MHLSLGQNIPENLEIDGLDVNASHYLIYIDDLPVGTARVRFTSLEVAKIERVAILAEYQGKGYGSQLMEFIIQDLRSQKTITKVLLGAQLPVINFYKSFGFIPFGEIFLDADIEHQMMELSF